MVFSHAPRASVGERSHHVLKRHDAHSLGKQDTDDLALSIGNRGAESLVNEMESGVIVPGHTRHNDNGPFPLRHMTAEQTCK
jgi:hypothetical protein